MYAIRLHSFGPAENLSYEEVPDPVPGPGQVRIDVAAAGVHFIDTSLRSGSVAGPLPLPELPAIPGREVAGVVAAVGPGVDGVWLGRRVVAHLGVAGAGYAEAAVTAVENLHETPAGVADDIAVAMIGTGRTAMGILDTAQPAADDGVLVMSAAGGLGALLVQAALGAGAFVVGAAGGAAKVDLVRGLGASVAVDYTEPGWTDVVRTALGDRQLTLGLDGVGGELGRDALELLAPGGRLVLYGMSSGRPTPVSGDDFWSRGLTIGLAIGPRLLGRPGGLRPLETRALAAAADGTLVPAVTRFPLKDAAAAHEALENRSTTGKVVLVP